MRERGRGVLYPLNLWRFAVRRRRQRTSTNPGQQPPPHKHGHRECGGGRIAVIWYQHFATKVKLAQNTKVLPSCTYAGCHRPNCWFTQFTATSVLASCLVEGQKRAEHDQACGKAVRGRLNARSRRISFIVFFVNV